MPSDIDISVISAFRHCPEGSAVGEVFLSERQAVVSDFDRVLGSWARAYSSRGLPFYFHSRASRGCIILFNGLLRNKEDCKGLRNG